mgnify:FL=1
MSANGIIEFSDKVINQLNSMPQLLPDWGYEDMRDDNVGGYFKNPVANVSQDIRDTCNTLVTLLSANANTNTNAVVGTTSEISTLFTTINTTSANVGGYNGGEFIAHTDRISGVTPLSPSPSTSGRDTALLPHYETAMATGQLMMYLVYQSDGVQNNSPIMNTFQSILVEDDLTALQSNISGYYTTISNSITISGSGTDLDPYVRQSNLSLSVVQNMSNNITTLDTTLATKRNGDEQNFTISRQISDDYNTLKQFNYMGATANNLIQNYIGSDKLLTRLNS